jgi:HK97 family phage prohead protease
MSAHSNPTPQAGGAVRFAGYAAVFDRVDRGGDVVRRGAFGGVARAVPLLWEHKGQAIGRCELIREDARGLRVIGRVTDARAAALVRERAVTGLSFGYRVRSFETRPRQARSLLRMSGEVQATRELTGLELVEVSLVSFPMQPLARVHAVGD